MLLVVILTHVVVMGGVGPCLIAGLLSNSRGDCGGSVRRSIVLEKKLMANKLFK